MVREVISINNKENIFYKPELGYDKNYNTKGDITESQIDVEVPEDVEEESLLDKIEDIKNVYPLIPDDLVTIIKSPLEIIESIVKDFPDKEKPTDEEDEIITIIPKDEDDDDTFPGDDFDDDDSNIKIEIIEKDTVTKIEDDYQDDLISIVDDYLNSLNEATNNYTVSILTLFKGMNPSLFLKLLSYYDCETSKISDNYKHLSDAIIRSQLSRNMKERLYLKMYDTDKTINHIRSCKVGVEQRLRYHQSKYQETNTIEDVVNNKILGQSRVIYDRKYKQNFYNLYKYLNSSVILLNECLDMCLSEMQAKIILLKREGDNLW